MKNKIAVNAKYYKASQVSGLQGHVLRLFAEDKNAVEALSGRNFGTSIELMQGRFKEVFKGIKGVKKNSNTLVDAVFVFPLEQWEKAKKNGMSRQDFHKAIIQTMIDIQTESGLTAIGYRVHLDEGHTDNTGKFILNPHAHMQFANACQKDLTISLEKNITVKDQNGKAVKDKKTKKWLYQRNEDGSLKKLTHKVSLKGKMPLQYLKGRGSNSIWSRMQDIAGNNFKTYGFERGDSKELTGLTHSNKLEFVQKKLHATEDKLQISEKTVRNLESTVRNLESKKGAILSDLKTFFNKLQSFLSIAIKAELSELDRAVDDVITSVNNDVIDELRGSAINCVHMAIESISDSTTPEVKLFTDRLKKTISKEKNSDKKGQKDPKPTIKARSPHP